LRRRAALRSTRYTALLKQDATMCLVGLPEQPPAVSIFNLIGARRWPAR
jgi:D-arabinose 1-dehydrogenase-like Zn-dependent alcohol dehydrogenase